MPKVGDLDGCRTVVTGGAGFLGSWVCGELLDRGAEVTCVDDLVTGTTENVADLQADPRFRLCVADVCRPLHEQVRGRLDWVLHLASPASPRHYLALPLETLRAGSLGTFNALELAEAHDARFVLASTSEVYGDPQVHPQTEDYWGNVNPVGPRSVYDEAKRFAEAATAAYRRDRGVDTGIARIFNTYGPRMRTDDGRVVPTFVSQALRGDPITVAGHGAQTRSLCFVSDTVAGLLALAASSLPGPVNLGNDEEVTVLALAERIRDLLGSSSPIEFVDLPQDDPQVRCPDITLASTELGWRPTVPLTEGLPSTLEWFRDQLGSPVS